MIYLKYAVLITNFGLFVGVIIGHYMQKSKREESMFVTFVAGLPPALSVLLSLLLLAQ